MANIIKFLVKLGLTGLTSAALVEKGRNLVTMLTGNDSYEDLQDDLPPITEACDQLVEANTHVFFFGGKIAYQYKHAKEAELRGRIVDIGQKVQVLSGGDMATILSAGFEVRKAPEPITELGQPQNLHAFLTGFTGKVRLDWEVVPGARYYQVWMVEGNHLTGTWQMVGSSSKSRRTVDNLVPGMHYTFRVNAVGTRTESIYSENATLMAA